MSSDLTSLFYVHVIKTPEIQEDTCQEKETQEDVGGFEKSNILESPRDGGPSVEPKGGLAPDTPARHPSSRRPSESPVVSNYDATRDESNENEPELDFPSNNEVHFCSETFYHVLSISVMQRTVSVHFGLKVRCILILVFFVCICRRFLHAMEMTRN